jgi:hypothetical protein
MLTLPPLPLACPPPPHSDYEYTQQMMSFAYDRHLPKGTTWSFLFAWVCFCLLWCLCGGGGGGGRCFRHHWGEGMLQVPEGVGLRVCLLPQGWLLSLVVCHTCLEQHHTAAGLPRFCPATGCHGRGLSHSLNQAGTCHGGSLLAAVIGVALVSPAVPLPPHPLPQ